MKAATWLAIALAVAVTSTGAGLAVAQCTEDDRLTAQLDGGGILATHGNATYNCCSTVSFSLSREDQKLVLVESEDLSNPCDCVCCFTLAARITDVSPGDWTVVLRWFDYGTAAWRELSTQVTVPLALAGEPRLGGQGQSRCGETDVVGMDRSETTWGAIKSMYR